MMASWIAPYLYALFMFFILTLTLVGLFDSSVEKSGHHSLVSKEEKSIQTRLTELEQLTQQLKSLNYQRQQQIVKLSHALLSNSSNSVLNPVPDITDLMLDPNSVRAKLSVAPYFVKTSSRGPRMNASLVFGLPTVKRPVKSYLLATLKNLIHQMSDAERHDSIIVVFIAEPNDIDYVIKQSLEIEEQFPNELESGLIEIISPPATFYPNMSNLQRTFGDTLERVVWRTKQNFDFAFLMNYCKSKALFYIQLEDDIISKQNYATKIKDYAIQMSRVKPDFLIIEFCQLGFIGKLFKTRDLIQYVFYFVMFANDKPCDWLIVNYAETKVCPLGGKKDCKKEVAKRWLKYDQGSLFQHVGLHSSLKGKVQKLVDKSFNKTPQFVKHPLNPKAAKLSTNLRVYQKHSLEKLYNDMTDFFWTFEPKAGDYVQIDFANSEKLEQLVVKSGNDQHPEDIFERNTTISIKLANIDHFQYMGNFDADGIASVTLKTPKLVDSVRIDCHSNSPKWLLVSEIKLQTLP